MTPDEARPAAVAHWLALADESLRAAHASLAAGSPHSAVNRAYDACFYAASALCVQSGREYGKPTAVRAAVNRDLVQTGRLEVSWGKAFNALFDARHEGDDEPLAEFAGPEVQACVDDATGFVARRRELLAADHAGPG
jgi:uncharacterized protein (UPF0332 family)